MRRLRRLWSRHESEIGCGLLILFGVFVIIAGALALVNDTKVFE